MRKFNRFFLCLLLSYTTPAAAQTYHPYRLPTGTRLQVSGTTYQGYNLLEYQTLLNMDNDLHQADVAAAAQHAQVQLLEDAQSQLHIALGACTDIRNTLEVERDRLNSELTRIAEENNQLQSNQDLQIVPWVIAGVLLVTTVIFGALLSL